MRLGEYLVSTLEKTSIEAIRNLLDPKVPYPTSGCYSEKYMTNITATCHRKPDNHILMFQEVRYYSDLLVALEKNYIEITDQNGEKFQSLSRLEITVNQKRYYNPAALRRIRSILGSYGLQYIKIQGSYEVMKKLSTVDKKDGFINIRVI